jgi:hypothetical protein
VAAVFNRLALKIPNKADILRSVCFLFRDAHGIGDAQSVHGGADDSSRVSRALAAGE